MPTSVICWGSLVGSLLRVRPCGRTAKRHRSKPGRRPQRGSGGRRGDLCQARADDMARQTHVRCPRHDRTGWRPLPTQGMGEKSGKRLQLSAGNNTVYRRQILTSIDGFALKELNIYSGRRPITYRYSNEAERANEGIYDDFKLKNKLLSPWFIHK